MSNRLMREIKTPVSLIAEDIHFVNSQLGKGLYFYSDIYREGILLHDSGRLEWVEPKGLTQSERQSEAKRCFDYGSNAAANDLQVFELTFEKGLYNNAAFSLHQVTERLYAMILPIFTHYKPKIHDLEKLRTLTGSMRPGFLSAFPENTPFERSCFERLYQAYVDSRYDPAYAMTALQLEWLAERVRHLRTLAEKHCQTKIARLG